MKDRLKILRRALGLRQRQLAERLGVVTGLVGSWEAGLNPIPKTRIYQICKEYNVRREWLEEGTGDMFEPEKGPRSPEEVLEEAAAALFAELSPRGKAAVLRALEGQLSDPPAAGKTININNSSIGGDVVQE